MKKVLFVATVTLHINTFHIPYLKLLKENGYEVHVASFGDEPIEYCDKHYNIPFERFPLKPKNYKAYKELKKIINENNYEIIHCHTPVGGVLTRLAAKKTRKNGTRVIYTAHGFHFYKGASLLNWIIYYPIEKWLSKYTDCLITINQEDYNIAKKKFKARKIEFVHGVGLNTSKLKKHISKEEKISIRKSLNIEENDIVCTYIAELNKNKNQILLINAIKELKEKFTNIKLLLIGKGDLFEYYEKIIKENNLEYNIKLLGYRDDINELLSITDLYLASSLREGLPVNIMEAMYRGVPIIASNNRGHRELIEDNKYGIIINIQEEMVENIIKIINNKELRSNIIENEKLHVKKYLIDNVEKEMKKLYFLGEKSEEEN